MFIEHLPRAERSPGSGSGIGNKVIIISAKQQSYTEEYGIVHGSSNHTRKNTKEIRRIARGANKETVVSRTAALMNVKVILQVAYTSAFRPSFCLNGSFAVTDRHTHTRDRSCASAGVMKALKCGTLGASFGKPCASGYVEGILDEYIHSIVRMYKNYTLLSSRRQLFLVGAVEI